MSNLSDTLDKTQALMPSTPDATESMFLISQLGRMSQNVDSIGVFLNNLSERLGMIEITLSAILETNPEIADKVQAALSVLSEKKE
jgi:hypothetical protein